MARSYSTRTVRWLSKSSGLEVLAVWAMLQGRAANRAVAVWHIIKSDTGTGLVSDSLMLHICIAMVTEE